MTTIRTDMRKAVTVGTRGRWSWAYRWKSPTAVIAMIWIGLVVMLSLFADLLPMPGYTTLGIPGQAPNLFSENPLGTDDLGRSILSRVIYGGRVSLYVGLVGTAIGFVVGGVLGLVAGYFGGWVEVVVDVVIAAVLALPALLAIMAIVAVVGADVNVLMLCLGALSVPSFARVVKANVASLKHREFVVAAQSLGASRVRILFSEILPNTLVPMFALCAVNIAILITVEGALSFLGLGVPPPTPSWGGMIAAGQDQMQFNPWPVLIPCVVIFVTILAFNVLGDYLRAKLDIGEGKL